jgi:hypothetical protein
MIQGHRQRNDAADGNESVGWLKADDAAKRGGRADGTAGIGAERAVAEVSGDSGRTAGRAAGGAIERPRITHWTE